MFIKIYKQHYSAGSDVSMYTSPTVTTSIVTIRLFNTHGSALTVTTKVRDSSPALTLSLAQT